MTTLQDDILRFDFPDVATELRGLVNERFDKLEATAALPSERKKLLDLLTDIHHESRIAWEPDGEPTLGEFVEWACSLSDTDVRRVLAEQREAALARFPDHCIRLAVSFPRTLRIPDDGKTSQLSYLRRTTQSK